MYYAIINISGFMVYESGRRPGFLVDLLKSYGEIFVKDRGKMYVQNYTVCYGKYGMYIVLYVPRMKLFEKENMQKVRSIIEALKDYKIEYVFETISKEEDVSRWREIQEKKEKEVSTAVENDTEVEKTVPAERMPGECEIIDTRLKYSKKQKKEIKKGLQHLRDVLTRKNVSKEVVENIVEKIASIYATMHEKAGGEKPVLDIAKNVVHDAIKTMKTDELFEKIQSRRTREPYKIVFIGVNGVGKSTTLAKVCTVLCERKKSILVAACDTFRSGAVEQLKKHVERFREAQNNVCLFECGYVKHEYRVALGAVAEARRKKYDIVLIDTSGRMQNNTDLMRSLEKLLKMTQPDMVVYVGECLSGNVCLEQIAAFRKCAEEAGSGIGAMILTKYDSVDTKIGTILDLTYKTGLPVLFVGTGQKNIDLKNLDNEEIAGILLEE